MLKIHNNIIKQLDWFINNHQIPNILFHGENGSGKKTLLNLFINNIYNNNNILINENVMYVECGKGKGIKFIRDELKYFAKSSVKNLSLIKCIVLINADKLTIDAQSALRRCIELFSITTRFFIIVENKYKLLLPILSRFCCIYVPLVKGNLYKYNIDLMNNTKIFDNKRSKYLKQKLNLIKNNNTDIKELTNLLYNNAYSALDLINEFKKMPITKEISDIIYKLSLYRLEIKDEKNIIFIALLLYSFIS